MTALSAGLYSVLSGLAALGGALRRRSGRAPARPVSPLVHASSIGAEHVSIAVLMGSAGTMLTGGVSVIWMSVGVAAGHLLLVAFAVAPLRRSGAYTLSDFAEWRLRSRSLRRLVTACVTITGCLYLMPQLRGAGLTLRVLLGTPVWTGALATAAFAYLAVVMGVNRRSTAVQAGQYWVKLAVFVVPAVLLLGVAHGRQAAAHTVAGGAWASVVPYGGPAAHYTLYSLLLGMLLGTMGLPNLIGRFHMCADGAAARRTGVLVLGLVSVFTVLPLVIGTLARGHAPQLGVHGHDDLLVLRLPVLMVPGPSGELLTGLLVAGALAAFLTAATGLTFTLAVTIAQCAFGGGVGGFRFGAALAATVAFLGCAYAGSLSTAALAAVAFGVAAATLSPMLLLGLWWRRFTDAGCAAGLVIGLTGTVGPALWKLFGTLPGGLAGALLAMPAACTAPLAFVAMVVVSLATPARIPLDAGSHLIRMHVPEGVLTPTPDR
ncbi:MAG: cation acetate symporter [Streptosporangiales bacterium]|nr:cation acetate symporter [Streptosporangiales bacterium]